MMVMSNESPSEVVDEYEDSVKGAIHVKMNLF